jgi:hypothetical protein
MSYITLRGRWYNIIVLNVHAPTEDKIDNMKGSSTRESDVVFDRLPKYHMKILLADCSVKVGRMTFSNQQFEIKVYTKLVMTMKLE